MFKFNLEPVLSLREKTEEQKKRELGKVTAKKEVLLEERNRILEEKKKQLNSSYNSNTLNIVHLKAVNQYRLRLDKEIEQVDDKIESVDKEIEVKRKELLKAVKDRKILGTLKERKQEEFRLDELRAEQNIVDEIVSFKYTSKEREAI